MERLGFDQARLLCTHSPNLNRWGIVSRQNKLDMELDFPVPAPQSRTIDPVPAGQANKSFAQYHPPRRALVNAIPVHVQWLSAQVR